MPAVEEMALEGNDERGMPRKVPYGALNPAVIYPIMLIVMTGLGLLSAWGIHSLNADKADPKIAFLKANDLGYLYLAFFFFGITNLAQQIFVALGRKAAHVDNPDQYVYEVVGRSDLPYVRMVQDGEIGAFNRAQRGIDNSRESFPMTVATGLLAGYVYPLVVLFVAVAYLFARTLYSNGYIQKTEGRMPGQAITMLATGIVLNGLVVFVAIIAWPM